MRALFFCLAFTACSATPARHVSSGDALSWTNNGGIETATAEGGLIVVRADPAKTPLELFNPADTQGLAIGEFAARSGLQAATNASMFAADGATSIGYMRNFATTNNAHVASKLQGFLLFHPRHAGDPAVKIGDRTDMDAYDTVIQTYRMWDETDGILWKEGSSIYLQVALVGVDGADRVLFFYHPDLVDVHDLVAQIIGLGLNLSGLLYLDGGHHGALYVAPAIGRPWNPGIPLPNVLGIR